MVEGKGNSVSLYADNCALRHLFAPIYLSNDPPLRAFLPYATETSQFHYRNVALLGFHHKRGDSFHLLHTTFSLDLSKSKYMFMLTKCELVQ